MLFTEEERITRNCNGVNKPPLDPIRMQALKDAVFYIKFCPVSERRAAWKNCITTIDTFNRDFRQRKEARKKKGNKEKKRKKE